MEVVKKISCLVLTKFLKIMFILNQKMSHDDLTTLITFQIHSVRLI